VHGQTWARKGKPHRLPATFHRTHGVRHLLAFYDVHEDFLWGYFRSRKRWQETLEILQRIRKRYPIEERIYLVMDNFSPHKRKEIRRSARRSNITIVWTPTNASWLNRIECQFTELKSAVFHNTFFREHSDVKNNTYGFLRYRNARNKKRRVTNLKQH
jgi:transposase